MTPDGTVPVFKDCTSSLPTQIRDGIPVLFIGCWCVLSVSKYFFFVDNLPSLCLGNMAMHIHIKSHVITLVGSQWWSQICMWQVEMTIAAVQNIYKYTQIFDMVTRHLKSGHFIILQQYTSSAEILHKILAIAIEKETWMWSTYEQWYAQIVENEQSWHCHCWIDQLATAHLVVAELYLWRIVAGSFMENHIDCKCNNFPWQFIIHQTKPSPKS